mmetsp:Transcript_2460/g.3965  ORF Transcript_2460/g.3965 Transcript_2460/m.3965 type:complete len:95 (+) Transcript_2460:2440-2724(+)
MIACVALSLLRVLNGSDIGEQTGSDDEDEVRSDNGTESWMMIMARMLELNSCLGSPSKVMTGERVVVLAAAAVMTVGARNVNGAVVVVGRVQAA